MKATFYRIYAQCENYDLGAIFSSNMQWCEPECITVNPCMVTNFKEIEPDKVILSFAKGPRYLVTRKDFDKMIEVIDLTEGDT